MYFLCLQFFAYQVRATMELLNNRAFVFIFADKDKRSTQHPYPTLAQYVADAGAEVFFIDIRWDKHKSMADCTFEATKKVQELINEFSPPETYFAGIGVGAMIAAHIGFMFRGNGMLLCSMKPFFQNELPSLPWSWRYHAKRKIYPHRNKPTYPAPCIEVPTVFLQGEKEKHYLNEKVMESRLNTFCNATVVLVPKSRGKLRSKAYLAALKSEILKLAGIEISTPAD